MRIGDSQFEPYLSAADIASCIARLGGDLRARYTDKNPVFLIALNGGFIFAADLLRIFGARCEITFTKIRSYEGMFPREVREFSGVDPGLQGRHIVIVEDIIDTGRTLYRLLEEARKLQPASLFSVALLQKKILRPNLMKADLTGFGIPDVFVVGYGMDYDGEGRNLPDIWRLVSPAADNVTEQLPE